MELIFEHWDAGGGSSYLYAADREIARKLKEQFPRFATYDYRGTVVGWQFTVPTRLIPFLRRRYQIPSERNREGRRKNIDDSQSIKSVNKVASERTDRRSGTSPMRSDTRSLSEET
jgi:hypothetical protein